MISRVAPYVFLAFVIQSIGCAAPQAPPNSCNTPTDCPASDNPCLEPFCDLGACTVIPIAEGTSVPEQIEGDCRRVECDGTGKTVTIEDDADVPVDMTSCTNDICTSGIPSNPAVAAGSACAENGGAVCNTSGACVECLTAADCPGQDTECATRACDSGACSMTYMLAGTLAATQIPGDCVQSVCDGTGKKTVAIDDMDVPNDGNACTADGCMNGVPQKSNLVLDSPCNQNGGAVCNGQGACVECNSGAQCSSGVCVAGVCNAPSCSDNVKNGTESDIDCGGACPPCSLGNDCAAGTDCLSGVCQSFSCSPPVVTATLPTDGATGIAVESDISVVFSGAMNSASIVGQTVSGNCSGSVQMSTDNFATCIGFSSASPIMSAGGTTATFTPSPALSYGSTYAIRVTKAVQGVDGAVLATAYNSVMGFTTETPPGASCGLSVVISQVYGGGGNSGAPFKNDFVELHNRGAQAVDLSGWSVQYASAAGTSWIVTNLSGSIAPGGYYLVQGAAGVNGAALPAPDASGMTNMSATAGKVALVDKTTALSGACPMGPTIVDLLGYGTTASCFEGSSPAPAGSNAASILRGDLGCAETNDNKTDFASGTVMPRNSASAAQSCICPASGTVNESAIPAEIDLCNIQSPVAITVAASSTTPMIYGRVFETGITEAPGANASMIAQVGYGTADINPTTQSGWMFLPMTYNLQVGNADEYVGTFVAPPTAGSYRYVIRTSFDGVAWTYCDLNGAGSSAGASFEITQLPVLTVTP